MKKKLSPNDGLASGNRRSSSERVKPRNCLMAYLVHSPIERASDVRATGGMRACTYKLLQRIRTTTLLGERKEGRKAARLLPQPSICWLEK
jgi:hypothetical protein